MYQLLLLFDWFFKKITLKKIYLSTAQKERVCVWLMHMHVCGVCVCVCVLCVCYRQGREQGGC